MQGQLLLALGQDPVLGSSGRGFDIPGGNSGNSGPSITGAVPGPPLLPLGNALGGIGQQGHAWKNREKWYKSGKNPGENQGKKRRKIREKRGKNGGKEGEKIRENKEGKDGGISGIKWGEKMGEKAGKIRQKIRGERGRKEEEKLGKNQR